MNSKKKKIRMGIIIAGVVLAVIAIVLNLKIEPADYTATLQKQIKTAQKLLDEAEIGDQKGQYPQDAVKKLEIEIQSAKVLIEEKAGYEDMKTGYERLKKECKRFQDSVNKSNVKEKEKEKQETSTGEAVDATSAAVTVSGEAVSQASVLAGDTADSMAQEADTSQDTDGSAQAALGLEGQSLQTADAGENISSSDANQNSGDGQAQGSTGVNNAQTQETSQQNSQQNSQQASQAAPTPVPPASSAESASSDKVRATIEIRCDTVSNNMNVLKNESIKGYIPKNGIILKKTEVYVKKGTSVADILHSVTRNAGIQLESSTSGQFGSEYIEGINYLYEFDCGDLSGWMYQVNGIFPNYGCSSYEVKDGDEIKFLYTCDLGRDLGAGQRQ